MVDRSLDFITYIFICGGVKMSTALLSVIAIIIIECLIIAYLIHFKLRHLLNTFDQMIILFVMVLFIVTALSD